MTITEPGILTRDQFLVALEKNRTFCDAVEGVRLLIDWHGYEEAAKLVAFDEECRRAVRAGNHVAALHWCPRVHGDVIIYASEQDRKRGIRTFPEYHEMPDGCIIRLLLSRSWHITDVLMSAAMSAVANEPMDIYE